ncbi:hypothetical protein N431DRAFT_427836 [Stipitochalara longipes BDJ]|nr:hypothetical protein N431DRAFT_427836 [Stipitochalara longipes BDJ]
MEMQSVLRCEQCNKPFDKQSTLKRHGYYCRSRRVVNATRTRSCISCARGKARCDNRRPECSRCSTKGIHCQYPANAPKGRGPRTQHNDDAPIEQQEIAPSTIADSARAEHHQDASNDADIILDNGPLTFNPESANTGGEYLDWNDLDMAFTDFLNPQTNEEAFQYPSSWSPSSAHQSTPWIDQTAQIRQAISSPNLSIPKTPISNFRSLISRPKMGTGAQRIANLILHTLKSYPLMMLRHKTLPPFIHPHLVSSEVENDNMEPLNNCFSLVHMISSGIRGSRKLFWKNVGSECEHFFAEQLKFNKWELLAAMQALSIYLLIRLDEGETDHNNYDSLLMATVTVIARQLTICEIACNTQSAPCDYSLKNSWKDWIFEESRRRLCVVYKIVNMLVYFEPAAMCDMKTELVIAPLPAKKQLWEADNESVWKAESEREPGARTEFGLAANGELVTLDEGAIYCGDAAFLNKPLDGKSLSRRTENWGEWSSGMDGFGGLVMLAASFVG